MVWQNDNRHLKDPEYLAGDQVNPPRLRGQVKKARGLFVQKALQGQGSGGDGGGPPPPAIRLLLANLQGISLRDTGEKSPTGDNTAVSLLECVL